MQRTSPKTSLSLTKLKQNTTPPYRQCLNDCVQMALKHSARTNVSSTRKRLISTATSSWAQEVSAEPKKVESIQDAAPPASAAELCSLLGLVNYVSRFIADYATITAPLRELSKKHAKWEWGDAHQKALEEIKNRLTSNIVMACFDPQKRTKVDAGPLGLGAILAQSQPSTDDFKVVA